MATSSSYDVGEMEDFARNVVKFLLNNSVSKLPIKRADIVAHALGGNAQVYQRAFEVAKSDLAEIYGIGVAEVPLTKSSKQIICFSTVQSASVFEYTPKQRGEITLLFIILSYIFMKGGSISEEGLFQILQKLKIKPDQPHSYFGSDISKLITEVFVKQLYLKKEKVKLETSNENSIMYTWGLRSTLEFPQALVLEEMAKLLDKPSVFFVRQHLEVYGEAPQEDEEMSQAN